MLSRRGLLVGLLAGAAAPVWAEGVLRAPRPRMRLEASDDLTLQRGRPAEPDASALVRAAGLTGTVAYLVMDEKTGAVLEADNADTPMPPASVAKSLTALYALDRLGPGFRFVTKLLATGPIEAGVLKGDLILQGGGDPSLQTDEMARLAQRLAKAGVKRVAGRFLYDESALPWLERISDEQPLHVGYETALSGLNLNFNRVHFEWARKKAGQWSIDVNARSETYVPKVTTVQITVEQRAKPTYRYRRSAAQENWTVASEALGKGGSRWLPVRLPGLYAADVFRTLARGQGVELSAPIAGQGAAGREIARLESAPLNDILRDMLRFSTNVTAEIVGLAASGLRDQRQSAAAMSRWLQARFGVTMDLVDHSGLGGRSRVTAGGMARVMYLAEQQGRGLKEILRNVGMKDDAGKIIKGHPVKVQAKTGTLNFASGLGGYITPPDGRRLAFAIFTSDVARRDAVPVAEREGPEGAPEWARSARRLIGQLVSRWDRLYG